MGRKIAGFEGGVVTKSGKVGTAGGITNMPVLIRSGEVVARVIAGETLVIPVRANVADLGSIYSFNETGTLIWSLLVSPRTLAELTTALAQKYDVEAEIAEQDVKSFVAELQSVGLVEVPAIEVAGD